MLEPQGTLSIESRTFVMMSIIMSTICMIITQYLMSEHCSDSISNRLAHQERIHQERIRHRRSTSQDSKATTTLINCVTEKSWSHKTSLHNRYRLINLGDKIIPVIYIHKELYILPRPSKAMAQWKFQYMQKEVYILSRPSKLQPMEAQEK